ncbi:MAG TPA: hypothetical protein VJJ82_05285 [Candidatus Nanoarchaeia archaeon]|nr:hypothetical protein [Candidatus Nanoarchaeia archaeon]
MDKQPLYGGNDIPIELSPCIPIDLVETFLLVGYSTVQQVYSVLSHSSELDELGNRMNCCPSRLEKIIREIQNCFEIDETHPDYWTAA